VTDLRRKLEHDELEDLDAAISYSGIMTSDAFALERFLVRIVHFVGEMKVARYDLKELQKEAALAVVAGPTPIRGVVGSPVPAGRERVPYIEHPFVPKADAWQFCASTIVGKEGEAYPCGGRIEAHKVVERCGLPREAHSIHPSPVNDRNSPSGHPFVAPIGGDSREAWQDCQMAVVARQDHDGGR
jgi:hypothetical protein